MTEAGTGHGWERRSEAGQQGTGHGVRTLPLLRTELGALKTLPTGGVWFHLKVQHGLGLLAVLSSVLEMVRGPQ